MKLLHHLKKIELFQLVLTPKRNTIRGYSALMVSGLFLLFTFPTYAVSELVIEEMNDFGGKTVEFTGYEETYLSVIIQYASDGKMMTRQNHYSRDYALLYGVVKETITYLFKVKVEEDLVYSDNFARTRGVRRKIIFYDQSTGSKSKSVNYFTNKHLGYNSVFFEGETRTKIEWIYPETKTGISKTLIYYSRDGKAKVREENEYTDRWAGKHGFYKTISYLTGIQKLKDEWYFTKNFSKTNGGYVKKTVKYNYDILHGIQSSKSYYFDQSGNNILLKQLSSK